MLKNYVLADQARLGALPHHIGQDFVLTSAMQAKIGVRLYAMLMTQSQAANAEACNRSAVQTPIFAVKPEPTNAARVKAISVQSTEHPAISGTMKTVSFIAAPMASTTSTKTAARKRFQMPAGTLMQII